MSNQIENMLALKSFADGMHGDGFTYEDLCLVIINEIPVERINEIIQNKGNNKPLNAKSSHGDKKSKTK